MEVIKVELYKLKIEKYNVKKAINFPDTFKIDFEKKDGQTEVILYYIDKISDVEKFKKTVRAENMTRDNRIIVVYKKGRNDDVTRDNIHTFFDNIEFKNRVPMLCSLSDELSAFCKSYDKVK